MREAAAPPCALSSTSSSRRRSSSAPNDSRPSRSYGCYHCRRPLLRRPSPRLSRRRCSRLVAKSAWIALEVPRARRCWRRVLPVPLPVCAPPTPLAFEPLPSLPLAPPPLRFASTAAMCCSRFELALASLLCAAIGCGRGVSEALVGAGSAAFAQRPAGEEAGARRAPALSAA